MLYCEAFCEAQNVASEIRCIIKKLVSATGRVRHIKVEAGRPDAGIIFT